MSRASATEGGQLSGFVLGMAHHLIHAQSRGREGASETTATDCSLSQSDKWEEGVLRREGFLVDMPRAFTFPAV